MAGPLSSLYILEQLDLVCYYATLAILLTGCINSSRNRTVDYLAEQRDIISEMVMNYGSMLKGICKIRRLVMNSYSGDPIYSFPKVVHISSLDLSLMGTLV
ncbi:hypothetical protein SK128_012983 [Halocaridina rubra]|uniref:Uncharacterized protein n=1 Tax=Halocaridina rubra TaxID=373956 RepID=A0AAN8XX45_HALRR